MSRATAATIDSLSGAEQAADVLAQAFTGDPLFEWLFPGGGHTAALRVWWSHLAAAALGNPGAELWHSADGASAALWYAPRFEEQVPETQRGGRTEPSAFDLMLAALVGDRIDEVTEAFAQIASAHVVEPHWYLAAVGTRPAAQGLGSGSALLAPVLDRCDQYGLGAYLESSNPVNLAFYFRLGFKSLGEIPLGGAAAAVTRMWRPPR
jgi:GNAT superfamily N-acetyltransferase